MESYGAEEDRCGGGDVKISMRKEKAVGRLCA
jgi:hypothetical protein